VSGKPLPAAIAHDQSPRHGCAAVAACTAGRLLVHIVALFLLISVLCSGFPVAWRFFEQKDIKLPAMTFAVYHLYRWMAFNWFWCVPAFLTLDTVVLAGLESLPARGRWLARAWFSAILVAILCFLAYIYAATVVPLTVLTESTPDAPNATREAGDESKPMP